MDQGQLAHRREKSSAIPVIANSSAWLAPCRSQNFRSWCLPLRYLVTVGGGRARPLPTQAQSFQYIRSIFCSHSAMPDGRDSRHTLIKARKECERGSQLQFGCEMTEHPVFSSKGCNTGALRHAPWRSLTRRCARRTPSADPEEVKPAAHPGQSSCGRD